MNLLNSHTAFGYRQILTSNQIHLFNPIDADHATYYHFNSGFSILDHCFTDLLDLNFNLLVHPAGFPGHNALIVSATPVLTTASPPPKDIAWTDYKKLDTLMIGIVQSTDTIDDFVSNLTEAIATCTVLKKRILEDDHLILAKSGPLSIKEITYKETLPKVYL